MSEDLRNRIASRRRIYLLRHGEVSYFDRQGRPHPPHAVPLNDEGTTQAEAAREVLRDVPLDRVIHSGVPRALQTVEIILRGRSLSSEACADLREIAPGPLAASPQGSSFELHFTGAFRAAVTREGRFLGGETFGAHADRVVPAFRGLLLDPRWKHMLVVAHGGTNRVILLYALGAGVEAMACLEQEAGCINVIDVHEGGNLLVRQVNFTPYSPVKAGIWATTMERIYLDHADAASARTAANTAGGGKEAH